MSATLQDKTVLVVGRGSGIARAVTLAARAAGARVVVAGRDRAALADAYDDAGVSAEQVDLTDEKSIAALAERLGDVDHVVSTASARARGRVGDLTPATLSLSFGTKVIGPIMLAKHFAPRVRAGGSFVFFSGSSALKPAVGVLGVAATNGAVDVVTKALSLELAPIRVNAVSPGTVDTGAWDGLGERKKAELFAERIARNPARRIGTAEDIAEAVLFAMTSTFMTGVSLPLDGGEPLV
ncbi:SDR family oxidoreductase [Streptosporangium lutulentum]|uniref:NAD(P)-dependent dehydrogenase (Short-subunit alcohol dehydrogenase family) n=1 Tax=Streptosporangium lutulentum TaxID=1461250 RepID=A0ABT9Q7S7_9ACTN|nr:SDR family oxidoreductase [Streptosporangium lutulentum]MDP9842801.1 NAD(P)-dependent dehydrogenase (short-subunit alcohol dehydrogenase family) [Streptosporangium lutulentum]